MQNTDYKSKIECYADKSVTKRKQYAYSLQDYLNDIDAIGIQKVWECVFSVIRKETDSFGIVSVKDFGRLYEAALEHVNKDEKKKKGQYYTPGDVCDLMSAYLIPLKGKNVCDVCCGTGNLILSYLSRAGVRQAKKLLREHRVWLFDTDETALYICRKTISLIYHIDVPDENCVKEDFLDCSVHLPSDSKVIANPPYGKIKKIKDTWNVTETISRSRKLYAGIMEKILLKSRSAVIISPYSFMGGKSFLPLRRLMNGYNGFIISFDNVPGNIFKGKKYGIFNSNEMNSVRAAITVVENKGNRKGFRCSGMVRFKSEERDSVIDKDFLEKYIGTEYQRITDRHPIYLKCVPSLENTWETWRKRAKNKKLINLTKENGQYVLYVPYTCRYYLTATYRKLDRSEMTKLSFDSKEKCQFVYCLLNSSFGYWYWRLCDGGIGCSSSLLYDIPVFFDMLSEKDRKNMSVLADRLLGEENECLVYKKNAGEHQENIKFHAEERHLLDKFFFGVLGLEYDEHIFDEIYSNSALVSDSARKGGDGLENEG